MNLELPDVAVEFGASANRAFLGAGGVDLARRVEAEPDLRTSVVTSLLDDLGAFDLALNSDPETDLAAGELCRVAGRSALPYPLAATLASPDGRDRPVALVAPSVPRADHGDLFAAWRATTLDGSQSWDAAPAGTPLGTKLGPFVTDLHLASELGPTDVSGYLTLAAWQLLGTLEQALDLVVDHVTSRQQFGGPLSVFQSVQFQVADIAVGVHSLRELARFTMARRSRPGDHLVDALALRVHATDTATQVLRACHQLHGAIGLCQEHDLSILSRHAQPTLRQPAGLEATTEHLLAAIEASGFDSLFSAARMGA
ncbi:MAG: putative acyl-CoA dehydrogenase [Acidimicrobiales bacterium]|nr:putative acyl-CoA dehydrogenase [Acidimicrobiales bacterium]